MAYSEEQKKIAKDIIIDKISCGDSLKRIMDSDNRVPKRMTVYAWLNPESKEYDKEFSDNYARARQEREDAIFDDMLDIADDGSNDFMKKQIGEDLEIEVLNSEHIQRSRLRIDARKWILSRMNPKKYGDKVDITTKDESLNKPINPAEVMQNINDLLNGNNLSKSGE